MRPLVAITTGDPAGVGPEIILEALADPSLHRVCRPLVLGDRLLLARCAAAIGATRAIEPTVDPRRVGGPSVVTVLDTPLADGERDAVEPGEISAAGGRAALLALERACQLAAEAVVDAIATAPLHKGALRRAGVAEIGHSELFAARFGVADPLTMFAVERLRIFFLSRHLSLRAAIDAIDRPRVAAFIGRVDSALRCELALNGPRIAVAALNPHGSDGGQFGDEERIHLAPAVSEARAAGIDVVGPLPADAVFHQGLEGHYDAVIALYHDQGHIAAKTRDFHGTVTATLGLPVPRTSVDHGTAFDIAWSGMASCRSMKRAILLAAELARSSEPRA